MRRTHLGVQIAIVLAMVVFVSWPQFRPVRAQSIWRYAPAAVLQARTLDAARYAGDGAGAGRPAMRLDEAAFRSATVRASRSNRSLNCSREVLIATARPNRESRAR